MKKFYYLTMAALLLLGSSVLGACSNESKSEPAKQVEEKAETPKVELADEEKLTKLISDAKGKILVLNFWATWCPPCVKEMPDFAKFYKEYSPDKVEFISLSANEVAKIDEQVVPFQEENNIPFDILVLNARDPDKFANVLGVELSGALPATIIYDKAGIPNQVWERDTTYDELKETIDKML